MLYTRPARPGYLIGDDMILSEFYTDSLRPSERFDAAEAAAASWTTLSPVAPQDATRVSWRQWDFGQLAVYDTEFTPLRFERLEKRFNPYDHEYLLLQIYGKGDSKVTIGDENVLHDQWTIFLFDMSRRYANVTNAVQTRGVLIPHSLIGYDPSIHPSVLSLSPHTPQGRVLLQAFWTLPDRLDALLGRNTEQTVAELVDLVRAMMLDPLGMTEARAVRRARRAAMESFIAFRLHDPALQPEDLCRVFGVSRASLYRLFEEEKGVAGYIRERRLEAVQHELMRTSPVRGVIRQVAEKWGFDDPAEFNRMYKRRFDSKPSDATGLIPVAFVPPTKKSPGAFLQSWLKTLKTKEDPSTPKTDAPRL